LTATQGHLGYHSTDLEKRNLDNALPALDYDFILVRIDASDKRMMESRQNSEIEI
jgi:hypothetical protein